MMKKISLMALLPLMLVSSSSWANHAHGAGAWLGGALLGGLVVGSIIEALPENHKVVIINDQQYYYDGTYYYQESPGGYVVVENPGVVVEHPQHAPRPAASDTENVVVPIATSNGAVMNIFLIKKGQGYVGPNGEYYDALPTKAQLQVIYGNEPYPDEDD